MLGYHGAEPELRSLKTYRLQGLQEFYGLAPLRQLGKSPSPKNFPW